jgi:hypothetical protein
VFEFFVTIFLFTFHILDIYWVSSMW